MAEKAKIIVYDKNDKEERAITVMYNPSEYSVSGVARFTGRENKKQFQITEMPEFKVSLFYDTYERGSDVRLETNKIVSLMSPIVSGKQTKRPPVCGFIWGKFLYRGFITDVQQKFTMFLGSGVPVRAQLDVTFTSQESDKKIDQSKGLEACRKLWVVKSGDRLDLIANEALKDPLQWRRIAELNKIDNPVNFPGDKDVGRTLVIPD